MPISTTDQLFRLIKSLTKAEKKAFRAFTGRIQDSKQLKYMQLFELMSKSSQPNDKELKVKLGDLDAVKYSNLKRHLYSQILTSLRLVYKAKNPNIKVREQIDFAYVLYGRGLYPEALKILSKAKKLAEKNHLDFLTLIIIELEKTIHSRHITRTKPDNIKEMTMEAEACMEILSRRISTSNLRVHLHKYYIQKGHVRNEEDYNSVKNYYEPHIAKVDENSLGLLERVYLYQSYVWYYYILNDFKQCFDSALKWVNLFKSNKDMPSRDKDLFLRGYHYLLTAAFYLKDKEAYLKYHQELEDFRKQKYASFNPNTKVISFMYVYTARFNDHIMFSTFEEGLELIPKTLKKLNRYQNLLDQHKVMIFYYKFAWLYLATGEADKATYYLQWILDNTQKTLRSDIQIYSRMMNMMAQYDLENEMYLASLIRQYDRYFKVHNLYSDVTSSFFKLIKRLLNTPLMERAIIMEEYLDQIEQFEQDPYLLRAFIFLDFSAWVKAKYNKIQIKDLQ